MMPRTLARAVPRLLSLLPLLGAVPRTGIAQSAASVAAVTAEATVLRAGDCGSATRFTTMASYRGISAAVLPAPVRDVRFTNTGLPAVAMGAERSIGSRWRAEGGVAVGGAQPSCAGRSEWSRAWGGLERRVGAGGIGLALGARSISEGDPTRDREGITVGAWRSVLGGVLSVEVRGYRKARERWTARGPLNDPSFPPRNTTGTDTNRTTSIDTLNGPGEPVGTFSRDEWRGLDARSRYRLAWRRLLLDLTFGGTRVVMPGQAPTTSDPLQGRTGGATNSFRLWGRADARVSLFSRGEIIAGFSSLPAQPSSATPARRMGMLGFGIRGIPSFARASRDAEGSDSADGRAPAAASIVRGSAQTLRLRLHIPQARSVELSSDATAWSAVAMTSTGDGWWEIELPVPRAHWRVNVRVDGGAWRAPTGLPALRDEFGGTVGLLSLD